VNNRNAGGAASGWIVGPWVDGPWIIGGSFLGFLFLALCAYQLVPAVTLWFLWVTLIDTPHFFGTYSRAYLDRRYFSQHRRRLLLSLLLFLTGPAVVGLCFLLWKVGLAWYRAPLALLVSVFGLWAYWHVVRQHFGILRLYQARDPDGRSIMEAEQTLLYAGQLLPFLGLILRHPEARAMTGLAGAGPEWSVALSSPTRWSWEAALLWFIPTALSALCVRLLILYRRRTGPFFPFQRSALIVSVVSLSVAAGLSEIVREVPLILFGAFVTVVHDVQYGALVWFHHSNRFGVSGAEGTFGPAARLFQRWPAFVTAALAFGVVSRLGFCAADVHPGCAPLLRSSAIPLFGSVSLDVLIGTLAASFAMHHYTVDQHVWRPSQDPELRVDLRLVQS